MSVNLRDISRIKVHWEDVSIALYEKGINGLLFQGVCMAKRDKY